jgi:membrane protein implicated in regulation of membrane protease activity
MNLKPALLAIRSIAAEFAGRLYFPVVIIFLIIAVILLALSIWLITINPWWTILLVLLFVAIFVITALLIVGYVIIKRVAPTQSKPQKQQTKELVDKLLRVAEVTGTPKFILLFNVIKDVVAPSEKGYIASISSDTVTLKRDFITLKDSFKP